MRTAYPPSPPSLPLAPTLVPAQPLPPAAVASPSLGSDRDCEHYTLAWVLDCVLSCLVHQIAALGVDALAPSPAEALATSLAEAALGAPYDEDLYAWHQHRRRERRALAVGSDAASEAGCDDMPGLLDGPDGRGGLPDDEGRTAPTQTHAPCTGPSG